MSVPNSLKSTKGADIYDIPDSQDRTRPQDLTRTRASASPSVPMDRVDRASRAKRVILYQSRWDSTFELRSRLVKPADCRRSYRSMN